MPSDERTVCHTPTPGKQPTSIPTWKYQLLHKLIQKVVPRKSPGIAAKELPKLVRDELSQVEQSRLGSMNWHVTTVKLNMEVDGELSRVPKLKPHHLVRT